MMKEKVFKNLAVFYGRRGKCGNGTDRQFYHKFLYSVHHGLHGVEQCLDWYADVGGKAV